MAAFTTSCGHEVEARPVKGTHGPQAGRRGPACEASGLKTGVKTLYSDSNQAAVIEEMSCFLGDRASNLAALLQLPETVIGFDVETSDWDSQYDFVRMEGHLKAGRPCCENHTQQAGHICEVGFAIFRRKAGTREYVSEDPVSQRIRLPSGAHISPKAFKVHGITKGSCAAGEDLNVAITPILQELRHGGELVVHNLSHETYVVKVRTTYFSCAQEARGAWAD